MEGDKIASIVKISQQRCDVAVANKNLGVRSDFVEIKLSQQVVGAVPTPSTHDGPHLVAHEHLFQLASSAIDRTGEVKIFF